MIEPPESGIDGPTYHRLTVKAVRKETADARSFVLIPERADKALFDYQAGQFLSFQIPHAHRSITRSYSLSSAPGIDPDMSVCVKRVADGVGSNWFHDTLRAGARIHASRPSGRFVLRASDAPVFIIAGGSGITPCISLIKHILFDTDRRVKLLYANQSAASVIYAGALEMLARRFGERFVCQHWLDEVRGLLSAGDIAQEVQQWHWADAYICGPEALMSLAEDVLSARLNQDSGISIERFVSPEDAPLPSRPNGISVGELEQVDTPVVEVRVILDDEEHEIPMSSGQTILQAALAIGLDLPHSCTEGHCGSCMARLCQGDVSMASTRALSKRNIERGMILACQAKPDSNEPVVLSFDL